MSEPTKNSHCASCREPVVTARWCGCGNPVYRLGMMIQEFLEEREIHVPIDQVSFPLAARLLDEMQQNNLSVRDFQKAETKLGG